MSLLPETATIKGAKYDVPAEVTAPHNWDVHIEHHKGETSVTTLQATRKMKSDDARKLGKLILKNLGQKEKALIKLGLLGVRISSNPTTAVRIHHVLEWPMTVLTWLQLISSLSSNVEDVPRRVANLQNLENLNFPALVDMINDLGVGHHSIQLTIFEKRPFLLKLGRATVVLLAIAIQIGLSFVAL
jgi:hypothetical protein